MKDRTLIAVMSCARYPDRRAAVRGTWMSLQRDPNVDVLFFVGLGSSAFEPDVIHLLCHDDWNHLPQKTYAMVLYALERNYTRLIKVDDDTYLRLPDALTVLGAGDCVGSRRENPPHNELTPYPQGGCYSLSRRAMQAVVDEPGFFSGTGLEDGAVGKALHCRGIGITHTDRIKTDYRLGQPAPGNDIVAAHHVSPAVMRAIHNQTYKGDILCSQV